VAPTGTPLAHESGQHGRSDRGRVLKFPRGPQGDGPRGTYSTILTGADLDLTGADLTGAFLNVANLTDLCYDDTTVWPDRLTPPPPSATSAGVFFVDGMLRAWERTD
jgi:hypothetical protein